MAAGGSGRVPQGEVVMDFADGGQYIRNNLENAVLAVEKRRILRDEGAKASKAMQSLEVKPTEAVKAEDAQLLVKQLGITQSEAEDALRAEKGDVTKAILQLTAPKRK